MSCLPHIDAAAARVYRCWIYQLLQPDQVNFNNSRSLQAHETHTKAACAVYKRVSQAEGNAAVHAGVTEALYAIDSIEWCTASAQTLS